LLRDLPADAAEAFCGVSNVSVFGEIPEGATVLDLGCGAGLDTLIAATRTSPSGKVIAVDFSETMLERARKAVDKLGAGNVEFHRADAESLPLEDASADVALVNGIFNLNPARGAIFKELARVVRSGGAVYASEIVVRDLPRVIKPAVRLIRSFQRNAANWFA
jgi:ubiquinone/menaquinone biosynthesis C-methylase UbiE